MVTWIRGSSSGAAQEQAGKSNSSRQTGQRRIDRGVFRGRDVGHRQPCWFGDGQRWRNERAAPTAPHTLRPRSAATLAGSNRSFVTKYGHWVSPVCLDWVSPVCLARLRRPSPSHLLARPSHLPARPSHLLARPLNTTGSRLSMGGTDRVSDKSFESLGIEPIHRP